MKTCTTAHSFNQNSNTNLLACCVFVYLIKCFNILCVHVHPNITCTRTSAPTHTLSHLHFPFILSCLGRTLCFQRALYLIILLLQIPTSCNHACMSCIFNQGISFWRCFTMCKMFFFFFVNVGEVGYKVKLHSVTSQMLL